ncbi:glycosyltransferase family protein [Marinigracilibium pacificum]|uniref:Glycosyltransferase family 39 protein n=1 Tax=Marinigracilibium pacificum TaxID=2729599 RepID=A0A848ISB1_9BACT|nr:hypothetical protein [Marinigracilibium pacificum]NMM47237.1 glycosyltransferase family 39 protein [Marinigracilibium pacificum]
MTNTGRIISVSQTVVILFFSVLPLFFSYPYRINIFLSWEGAYRIMNGEIPFRDFGIPMGYAYWVLPSLFFKVFGPKLFTLIICQVFINIIGGLTFIGILRQFRINNYLILVSAFVYGLTYIFLNYWPWYNHSAFIFGQIGLYFTLRYILQKQTITYLILSGLFAFISFWTKQDYGALFMVFTLILLGVKSLETKKFVIPLISLVSFLLPLAALFILHGEHNIHYWFNYGQSPHSARIMPVNFIHKAFGESFFEKVGLLILFTAGCYQLFNKELKLFSTKFYFILTICGILCLGFITKVTSVLQLGNDAFIYAYIFAGILGSFEIIKNYNFKISAIIILIVALIGSELYWGYATNILKISPPITFNKVESNETYEPWITPPYETFNKIKVPKSTSDTMLWLERLNDTLPEGTKVLNMSELTPLNHEFNWAYDNGTPLWFHYRVSIFDKEIDEYCQKIKNKEYGMVIFENIPNLNNFYPEKIKMCLEENYKLIRTCSAPRQIKGATIDIYVK